MPDRKAPKTAPVKASGGIPISDIRITPIATAQASEYHGPRKTAHVTFTKCCIGANPSTRSKGEITTPTATIIAKKTKRFKNFPFVISVPFLSLIIFENTSLHLIRHLSKEILKF